MYRRRISSGNLGLRSPNHHSSKISLRLFHESTNPASTTQNHSNSIINSISQDFLDFTTFEYETLIPKMAILEFLEKKFTKKVNNFILVITQGGLRGVIAYWLKKFEIFFFKFFKKKIPTAKKINKFKRLFSNSNVGFKKTIFHF